MRSTLIEYLLSFWPLPMRGSVLSNPLADDKPASATFVLLIDVTAVIVRPLLLYRDNRCWSGMAAQASRARRYKILLGVFFLAFGC